MSNTEMKKYMTDSEMIDWLEAQVNEHGALLLHDGQSNPHHHLGLGLRPGFAVRTLREAISHAAGSAAGTGSDPARAFKPTNDSGQPED